MSNINEKYGESFIKENLMGPNVIKLAEELARHMELRRGMRVLDLGCGRALSSIYLAKEYGVTVFATDLWIPATENYERIKQMRLEDRIVPIHADAHALPYADEFFDAIVSFDSYHYYGTNERYLNDYLAKLVKKGGQIAFASPGFTHELSEEEREELREFNPKGEFLTFHSGEWWKVLLERTKTVDVVEVFDLDCNAEAWEDWLDSDNPLAKTDQAFYETVTQLATVGVVARRNSRDPFLL